VLIYVATYPRCGNAFLRDHIAVNFRLLTANGYPSDDRFPDNWNIEPPPEGEILQTYAHPEMKRREQLLPHGALPLLTSELRKELAASPNRILVKTHELPPTDVFPGEMAVQFVRHPGAAVVSYWRLLTGKARPKQITLDDVIEGRCQFGDWSDYHLAWDETAMPVMRLRYEDALADPPMAIRALAEFLGVTAPPRPKLVAIKDARARNPLRNPGEGLDGWRRYASLQQKRRIWQRHGTLAYRYGYTPFPGARSVRGFTRPGDARPAAMQA